MGLTGSNERDKVLNVVTVDFNSCSNGVSGSFIFCRVPTNMEMSVFKEEQKG